MSMKIDTTTIIIYAIKAEQYYNHLHRNNRNNARHSTKLSWNSTMTYYSTTQDNESQQLVKLRNNGAAFHSILQKK
jgi:hypothetical protein